MSNIFDGSNPYFQIPQRVRKFKSKNWTLAEVLLYQYLLFEGQRQNMIVLERSNSQINADTGLDDTSIRSGRGRLVAKKFILIREAANRSFYYTLCGSDGMPLDPPVHAAPNRTYNLDFNHCTPEQYKLYYETRLGYALDKDQNSVVCPFHDDHKPSMTINTIMGVFDCHVCGLDGGMVLFEERFSGCGKAEAGRNISQIIRGTTEPAYEKAYDYLSATGTVLYQILRMQKGRKSRFTVRRPVTVKGKVKWVYNLHGVEKVPYHLPDVMERQWVMVTEGEKDADTTDALVLVAPDGSRYATTCNPFGAGKWRNEFSPYFHRKKVVILGDDDEVGKEHALAVQRSIAVFTFATDITVVTHWQGANDVTEYLEGHSPQELTGWIDAQTSGVWFSSRDTVPPMPEPVIEA